MLGSNGSPVCLWEDGRTGLQQAPSGSQGGMAGTRPFVPCYEKELKAETAFSPRGILSASHSQAINS